MSKTTKSPEVAAMEKIEREAGNKRFSEDANWIQQVVAQAQLKRFTGSFTLNFHQGVVNNYNHSETVKPPHVEPR